MIPARAAVPAALALALLAAGCSDARRSVPPPPHIDWARYHLKLDNSAFNDLETTITKENVGGLREAWSFRADDPVAMWGALAVAGGRVLAGDAAGKLYVLDEATGTLERTLDLGNNRFGGGAYATPTIDGDFAYLQDAVGNLIKYDLAAGREVWRAPVEPNNAGFSSPALWNGMVFHALSNGTLDRPCTVGKVEAYDAATGRRLWVWNAVPSGYLGGGIWNSPAIDEARGHLYVATGNPPNGNRGCGEPIPARTRNDWTDSIVALDARTGRLVWGFQAVPGDDEDHDFSGSSCVLFNDGTRDLVAAGSKDGHLYAVDRATGRRAWARDLRGECRTQSCGAVFSPAGFAYGKLYLNVGFPQLERGQIPPPVAFSGTVALAAADARRVWSVPGDHPQLGGPAIANGMVFIGNTYSLFVFDAETGQPLFEYPTGAQVWVSPVVANGRVYFGSLDGTLTVLSL